MKDKDKNINEHDTTVLFEAVDLLIAILNTVSDGRNDVDIFDMDRSYIRISKKIETLVNTNKFLDYHFSGYLLPQPLESLTIIGVDFIRDWYRYGGAYNALLSLKSVINRAIAEEGFEKITLTDDEERMFNEARLNIAKYSEECNVKRQNNIVDSKPIMIGDVEVNDGHSLKENTDAIQISGRTGEGFLKYVNKDIPLGKITNVPFLLLSCLFNKELSITEAYIQSSRIKKPVSEQPTIPMMKIALERRNNQLQNELNDKKSKLKSIISFTDRGTVTISLGLK